MPCDAITIRPRKASTLARYFTRFHTTSFAAPPFEGKELVYVS